MHYTQPKYKWNTVYNNNNKYHVSKRTRVIGASDMDLSNRPKSKRKVEETLRSVQLMSDGISLHHAKDSTYKASRNPVYNVKYTVHSLQPKLAA